MKTLYKTLFFLSFLMIFSCNKKEAELTPADPLIGYWINPDYSENQITFEKATDFKENGYGIAFLEEDKVIERSGGWCGTPPITYSNLEGEWDRAGNFIEIVIPHHWMGDIQWEIVSLEDDELTVIW